MLSYPVKTGVPTVDSRELEGYATLKRINPTLKPRGLESGKFAA